MSKMAFSHFLLCAIALGLTNGAPTPSWNTLLRTEIFAEEYDIHMTRSADTLGELRAMMADPSVSSEIYATYLAVFRKEESRQSLAQFVTNVLSIAEHNLEYDAGRHSWDKGINQFTDMTSDELKAYGGGGPLPTPSNTSSMVLDPEVEATLAQLKAPTAWDWRDQGAITPIKDQGNCGSCWAFSSVSVLESFILRKNGQATILSEQEMVDCDRKNKACQYGWIEKAFDYLRRYGVMTSSDYPYNAKEGTCRRGQNRAAGSIGQFSQVSGEERMKEAIANYGPASVGVVISDDWYQYKSGIYEKSCGTGGHFVSIVGWNQENGRNYWIVRNSWGTWWGEQGYMKLPRGIDKCGVETRNGAWFISK